MMTTLSQQDIPGEINVIENMELDSIQVTNDEIEKEILIQNCDISLHRNQVEDVTNRTCFSEINKISEIASVYMADEELERNIKRVNEAAEFGECCLAVSELYINETENQEKLQVTDENLMQTNVCTEIFIPPYEFQNFYQISSSKNDFYSQDSSINCFLKGCKWSPDGTCLLTSSNDNCLRVFELPLCMYEQYKLTDAMSSLPEMSAIFSIKHGGIVYDFSWYPYMMSTNHETCCLVSTSFCSPVQLWDAFTGQMIASYRGYDQYDEVTAATSLTFNPSGDKLICGYNNCVKVFDTNKPGRDYDNINIKEEGGQTGIVSCLAVNPAFPKVFAIGTYKKTVGLYTDDGTALCLLKGQARGLTHIQFSPDGSMLYTGGRKDRDILCWDIRNLGQVLFTLQRNVTTNQRMYFDITHDGRYVISGSTDGGVSVWDTTKPLSTDCSKDSVHILQPVQQWTAHNDCTNGISIHRQLPLLATSSGQRHVSDITEEDISLQTTTDISENCFKVWWVGPKDEA